MQIVNYWLYRTKLFRVNTLINKLFYTKENILNSMLAQHLHECKSHLCTVYYSLNFLQYKLCDNKF